MNDKDETKVTPGPEEPQNPIEETPPEDEATHPAPPWIKVSPEVKSALAAKLTRLFEQTPNRTVTERALQVADSIEEFIIEDTAIKVIDDIPNIILI